MIHSIIFLFALLLGPQLAVEGLRRIFPRPHVKTIRSFTTWHLLAMLAAAAGVGGSHLFADAVTANFIQHLIGGGVTSFCLVMYGVDQLKLKLTVLQLLVLVVAVVSLLGVANELVEYVIELTTGRIFSWDTHDTWRDLAANTIGGGLGWLGFVTFRRRAS